jgi:hypothetical protein
MINNFGAYPAQSGQVAAAGGAQSSSHHYQRGGGDAKSQNDEMNKNT